MPTCSDILPINVPNKKKSLLTRLSWYFPVWFILPYFSIQQLPVASRVILIKTHKNLKTWCLSKYSDNQKTSRKQKNLRQLFEIEPTPKCTQVKSELSN